MRNLQGITFIERIYVIGGHKFAIVLQVGNVEAAFLADLTHSALGKSFSFFEPTLRQIPATRAENEEHLTLLVRHTTTTSLYHGENFFQQAQGSIVRSP